MSSTVPADLAQLLSGMTHIDICIARNVRASCLICMLSRGSGTQPTQPTQPWDATCACSALGRHMRMLSLGVPPTSSTGRGRSSRSQNQTCGGCAAGCRAAQACPASVNSTVGTDLMNKPCRFKAGFVRVRYLDMDILHALPCRVHQHACRVHAGIPGQGMLHRAEPACLPWQRGHPMCRLRSRAH